MTGSSASESDLQWGQFGSNTLTTVTSPLGLPLYGPVVNADTSASGANAGS